MADPIPNRIPFLLEPVFPAPLPTNSRSLRFYETGTATADYSANSFPFVRVKKEAGDTDDQAWSNSIRIRAGDSDLNISFDGTNDHGFIPAGETQVYWDRHEGGIAVKGGGTFHIEAW